MQSVSLGLPTWETRARVAARAARLPRLLSSLPGGLGPQLIQPLLRIPAKGAALFSFSPTSSDLPVLSLVGQGLL